MRKALKAVTLMGLAAALVAPAATVKAADMEMGSTKVTIGGQLRERLEWYADTIEGAGKDLIGSYRARLYIKAELADGVTAVFTPQAYGVWGEGEKGQGLGLGESSSFRMHEAYMLLSNPFGIDNVIIKLGRQEINLGNQRLVGAVGWSQAGRSFDGILAGYVAGDYGLAGFFYGKLYQGEYNLAAWATPEDVDDVDLYVATWQGKFKPFGIGGTYEITDIFVQPTAKDTNVNTLYARVTPAFDTDFAKIKVNLEGAIQSGDAYYAEEDETADFQGYFFSVGAGADFDQVTWAPSVFIGYDYYSGDNDPSDNDLDAFWSVLPTAHKWLGHADLVWVNTPFYQFNGKGLLNVITQALVDGDYAVNIAGATDLYVKLHAKPTAKLALGLDLHYFKAAEDVKLYDVATGTVIKNYGDDIGWEADLEAKYKYSKNLCLTVGYDYFNPDDAMELIKGDDNAEHHIWAQADLKF